jgi:thiosulfate reductase cytochrome b subunit
MTRDIQESISQPRKRLIHPLTVRTTHWINAIAILIMIGSGWRIWNSSPIFHFKFPIALSLGGEPDPSSDLHNEEGLANALQWHFGAMWILVINGVIYVLYGILSGHFRRTFLPAGPTAFIRRLKRGAEGALSRGACRWRDHGPQWTFDLETGQFQELAWLFGGYDIARVVHFLGMSAIVLFIVVHLSLVIIVPKTLPTMITGRAPAHDTTDEEEELATLRCKEKTDAKILS